MNQTITFSISLAVDSLLRVVTTELPRATVGAPYTAQFQAEGGVAPYQWSAVGLPPGLTLSPSGLLSGTPSAAGTYNVAVTVRDAG